MPSASSALEIHRLSGQPMSALLARQADARTFTGAADARYRVIALEPSDRAVLHARIADRFDAMLEGGLIEEVERLRARGDLHLGLPSMRCVGYRQVWEYLDGDCDFATMRERGIAATRQLCKRQLTWLRSTRSASASTAWRQTTLQGLPTRRGGDGVRSGR
jgi:tRNA dimethylallyltransferase